MSDPLLYDTNRYEFHDGDISLDFRLNVPKAPHEDLRSSARIEDGNVRSFELRLGLLSKERYTKTGIEERMLDILDEMDLPPIHEDFVGPDSERRTMDELRPKVTYDPHWGEFGFWQVHLTCHTFFPPAMNEAQFIRFACRYTRRFIGRFNWDEVDA